MTAPLKASAIQWSDKRGIGRDKSRKPGAKHVEEQECEGLPVGTHELTNREGVTFCRWCEVEWWAIDQDLRSAE